MPTSVNDFSPFLAQPVRSVQTYLREIGNTYSEMPKVIPDGIFGPETERSVRWFQEFAGLQVTGIVDKKTWDTILEEYFVLLTKREPPNCIRILPDDFDIILPGDKKTELHPIQSLLRNLSNELETVQTPEITGVHDEKSVNSVKSVQRILGKEPHGNIDKEFWNDLTALYEVHISRPRFQR